MVFTSLALLYCIATCHIMHASPLHQTPICPTPHCMDMLHRVGPLHAQTQCEVQPLQPLHPWLPPSPGWWQAVEVLRRDREARGLWQQQQQESKEGSGTQTRIPGSLGLPVR